MCFKYGHLFLTLSLVCLLNSEAQSQNQDDPDLLEELMKNGTPLLQNVFQNSEKHRVQILYTQIERDENNRPSFKSFAYRVNKEEYFYPASSIKIIGAALSLEKINQLGNPNLTKGAWMKIDSSYSGQTAVISDSTSKSLKPSLAHYIKKLLVVSDNDAYNRTYEFLGQEELNDRMLQKGFDDTRLTHRLSLVLSQDENRHTNAMTFYSDRQDKPIYKQEAQFNSRDFTSKELIPLGTAYIRGEELINSPMDFSGKNACSIEDLQKVIKTLIFPDSANDKERFDLSSTDYEFLYRYMSQLPRETEYPDYTKNSDNYCKFFMYGDNNKARIPGHIRIFNKIGLAYGFCIDNAYIVDLKNNIEFLLTAVIYTNENQTLNDGEYEYEEVAFPFMDQLGRAIYEHELKRTRIRVPDLDKYKLTYDISKNPN